MTTSESTSTVQHAGTEQRSPLSSRLPPMKPLEAAGLPSLRKLSSMRSYKLPSSMKVPYDTHCWNDSKYPMAETSLASLLASRRSHLQRIKQRLATEMPFALSRQVSFGMHDMDTSSSPTEPLTMQHEPPSLQVEPAPKRRRFQRRNSKTPAMLMSSVQHAADIAAAAVAVNGNASHQHREQASLDGGLEIAQELVRQLQLRRQKSLKTSTSVDAAS